MKVKQRWLNRIRLGLAFGFAVATLGLVAGAFNTAPTVYARPMDCDANSIINCGFGSKQEFIKKLRSNNSGNGHRDLKVVFSHFGFTARDYDRFVKTAKPGLFHRDGRVTVGGKTVATNVRSIGRDKSWRSSYQTLKIGNTNYYYSDPNTTFASGVNALPMTVMFDANGDVEFMVMNSCGNPGFGDHTKSSVKCDLLKSEPVADRDNTYSFTSQASKDGNTKIKKYVYQFGDGTKPIATTNPNKPVVHTYKKSGKFTARVTVYAQMPNGKMVKKSSQTCTKLIDSRPKKQPAVDIKKTVNKSVLEVGEKFTYTLKVTNTGETVLKNVLVTDKQPQNIKFLEASKGKIKNNAWRYVIPKLTQNESMEFTITAKVTKYVKDKIDNTACVNAPSVNPDKPKKPDECDSAKVKVVKKNPGVGIEKTVSKSKLEVGEAFIYTVKVTNTGDQNLKNVVVYDKQPPHVQFLAASEGKITGGEWRFVIPLLAKGESKSFTINAKVTEYFESQVPNTACVNAPEVNPGEPNKDDDCDTVPIETIKKTPSQYACESLTASVVPTNPYSYNFSGKNTYTEGVKFVSATLDFGDNTQQVVKAEGEGKTFAAQHTYKQSGEYETVASVTFTDGEGKTVTSTSCKTKVTVVTPYYSCVQLTGTTLTDVKNGYNFVATYRNGNGATFVSADFDFGDGSSVKDQKAATATTVSVNHTYERGGSYTVQATLKFNLNGSVVTAPVCKATVQPNNQPVPECKPGIPVGDKACEPCPYDANLAADDPKCTPPIIRLPNTGAGGLIALGLAAIIGGFLAYKQVLLKKHKNELAGLSVPQGNGNVHHRPKQ